MRTFRLLPVFALAALAAAAHAQLVFGSTSTVTTGAYYLDLNGTTAPQLWSGSASGRKINGLTADTAGGVLYNSDSARLSRWSYGTAGTAPTFLTGFYRPTTSTTTPTTASGVDGLAFARGNLYAYTNFASTIASAGIYRVNLGVVGSASVANMVPVWTQTDNLQYNLVGLDYDPVTGLMYGTNTPTTNPSGGAAPSTSTGIYAIDVFAATPTLTKIADFDTSFLPAPDGLTIGNGKIWMSGKPAGTTSMLIESYDLTTHAFGDKLSIEFNDSSNRSTDLAWAPGALNPVPEPASLAALGFGALALLRRRRRA